MNKVNHKTKVVDAEDIGHITTQLIKAKEKGYEVTVDINQEFENEDDIYAKNSTIIIKLNKKEGGDN